MAIQMRRGLKADFDPSKMLPGEWAVSIDASSRNQIVWMCFAAGVCKRMGTYEDFAAQVAEATEDIRAQYISEFDEIRTEIQTLADTVSADKDEILVVKSDIIDTYLPQIEQYVMDSQTAAETSVSKAKESSDSATLSKSYAVGNTGTRENEDADNSKYYYEQTKQISQGINGIVPMGTVTFAELPTEDIVNNAMYNVSDAFTSDERFNDGGGIYYGPGNNVVYTAEGKWDVTASSAVTGIRGANEATYRQGNVTITKENIGLGNVDNTSDADKPISTATQEALNEINSSLILKDFLRQKGRGLDTLPVGFKWEQGDDGVYSFVGYIGDVAVFRLKQNFDAQILDTTIFTFTANSNLSESNPPVFEVYKRGNVLYIRLGLCFAFDSLNAWTDTQIGTLSNWANTIGKAHSNFCVVHTMGADTISLEITVDANGAVYVRTHSNVDSGIQRWFYGTSTIVY